MAKFQTMFNWLNKIILWLFKKPTKQQVDSKNTSVESIKDKQIYYYKTILKKDITPNNDSIAQGEFITVIYKNKSVWALFKCPCGCRYVITLPLQKPHNPRWTIYESEFGRPTLRPSIWQNKGCYSHFWIEDGKIVWCKNTGTETRYDTD